MPRFVCDAMLGSLARWLRFLGYDTEFLADNDDDVVAELARREERWLLTRDRELAAVGPRSMLVRAEALEEQLREVLNRLDLHPAPTLEHSRCGECNGELEDVELAEVEDSVPPFVARTAERFRRCRGCGRVYWPGTHSERILARLERVVGGLG
jgi:uncharacterized protein with PIN domain